MDVNELLEIKENWLLDLKLQEKSNHTINHYSLVVDKYIEFLKSQESDTKLTTIEFKKQLVKEYSSATTINYITVVNKFIKYCGKKENTVKNIRVQQRSSLDDVLTPNEFKRLVRYANAHGYEQQALIMEVFAYTGIRLAELDAITVESLNDGKITVTNKGKTRNIIIRDDLKKKIRAYCKKEGITTGWVFRAVSNTNKPVVKNTLWKQLKAIASKCRGIPLDKVHPHSFRHMFALQWCNEQNDITELADILGHSTLETTRIYTRTTDQMKKEKLSKMKY